MSSFAQDLAEKLALDTVNASEKYGNEDLPEEIARNIGSSSPTTEELFRTAVRVIISERRARKFLEAKIAGFKASEDESG
ncbi:hypothetical protein V8J82_16840 [Gymnodinialimonas sp. 2305UL16-5]|uniref:hypothetical protein n=1 Tax=Gymnodinialimonas mytili TaxID=3126503 RepID=UPI00309B14B7